MKLSIRPLKPCTIPIAQETATLSFRCCTLARPRPTKVLKQSKLTENSQQKWERFLDPVEHSSRRQLKLGRKWKEYQGIRNWDGLLDPLDNNLRREILRYGQFVDAAYKSFDFDPSSSSYGTCKFPKTSLFEKSELPETGYRLTRNLRATSGISLPRWVEKAPNWVATQSSWIGYVAVCQDKKEIARLGRRDVVIAYRGTATCLEWLENLRATLTPLSNSSSSSSSDRFCGPMVESGFHSLYTSGSNITPSLQQMVRQEITRLLQSYGDEPLSLTITGHSLGAALATLTAYDIKTTFKRAPFVTVISFGGPRVGNRSFRSHLEKQGTKVLRIVNSDDLITKVPGFVLDEREDGGGHVSKNKAVQMAGLPSWIQKRVEDTPWGYAEVGKELRLSSRDSPYLNGGFNVASCHDLKTYLHLVDGFVSSTCPFRATARRMLGKRKKETAGV